MNNTITTSGKRKSSKASAVIGAGNGIISINRIPYSQLPMLRRLSIEEPIRIANDIIGKIEFNVKITVRGGGKESRIEASRLALARAIVKFTKSENLKKAYSSY